MIAQAISNSRQEIRNQEYARNLWRNEPVDKLFPNVIGLQDPEKKQGDPNDERGWTRVAISEDTSCDKALSQKFAQLAAKSGCVAAVRATYVDDTGGSAATIAIVTLKREDTAWPRIFEPLLAQLSDERVDHAVRALAAPGTKWDDRARTGDGGNYVMDTYTPCFVVATAGPADGRKPGRLPQPWGRAPIDQWQDRSPWVETAKGLAKSVAWRLTDLTFGA
ncbi:hypothetical protein [Microtetraspora sp. NBRC 16547]|uniref:hypothetical protein n=1 Tax=Microtetraspora sp. NBRC 16547 TaxID=3030993 RepID=UPI002554AF26|nr:hypothetical protein [Microtetraspora sp. NBRC 16547]